MNMIALFRPKQIWREKSYFFRVLFLLGTYFAMGDTKNFTFFVFLSPLPMVSWTSSAPLVLSINPWLNY